MPDPQFHPDRAENDQARLDHGGHLVRCSACLYDWVCCCSLPVCIFTGTMCDGCALDYHDAQDEAEETGHHGDPLHPDHDLVTMTVDAADGRTTIAYRAGAIVYRAPADVPGSGA